MEGIRWVLALHTLYVLHIFPCYMPLFGSAFPVLCPAQHRGSVLCHCVVLLQSLPVAGTGSHRDDAYSAVKSLAGSDCELLQLLHRWISEQFRLSHGLTQTSVAATSTKTAFHNHFAVGSLSFSLVSSSDFFCVQGLYLQT